ncbi:DNA polymerase III subunit beta [Candidatus Uhrbacteria bacterium]|nr:DNA polymerase III subunit beta [Candidatus Uhrbacteria bacterium]
MKFSCTRENLAQALSIVSHITSKNIQLPILNNVLMKTDGKILKFFSTNLEISISCLVRGHVEEEGSFTVPSKLFSDYVGLLPNDRIDLELRNDDTINVVCQSHETKIKGVSAVDFPLFPKVQTDSKFRINAKDLKGAIEGVIFAVSPNETRPEISGVLFDFRPDGVNGKLILAATDSYRLAEATIGLHGEGNGSKVIIPSRTAAELMRILSIKRDDMSEGESVEVSIGESQIVFAYDSIELISRIIEGRYPEYSQVIPDSFGTEMTVEKEVLAGAVRAASLFSKSGLHDVTIAVEDGGEVLISSADNQIGENKSKIKAELKGRENTTTLNYRYLLDGVGRITSNKIFFRMVDGVSPCVITPGVGANEIQKYVYIVMPIKQ